LVRLIRYEPTAAVVLGGFSESDDEPFPSGSRWKLDTPGLLSTIRHTGRAARVEDYAQAPGDAAGAVRAAGMRSAVGSPIVVEGRVWGAIVLLSPRRGSLPEDTGARLADFTELVATALANAESRAALSQLADEQAALRRVATLVAREASPVELLATVAEEVARVLDVEAIGMLRFEPDGTATLVAQSETPWDPPPLGTRFTLEGENVVTAVFRTREAARLDDWAKATGPVAAMASVLGIRSSVATPIVVEGRLWGTLIAVTSQSEPLPRETDSRIGEFTELVATAIANAGARDELSRLVEEQAALRRVATLVAEGAAPTAVFDAVITEAGQLLGAAQIGLARYENEHEISVLAIRGQSPETLRAGMRLPLDGDSVNARILRTGRSARLNFAEGGSGSIAEVLRRDNVNATVGAPIVVDGAVWGMIGASWRGDDQPPANAEERVEKFTELVATAIASTERRAELAASEARFRVLAREQAALLRVATLVANGASSDELFAAVTREAADVLDVPVVALQRYEHDRTFTMVGIAGETSCTVGSRVRFEDEGVAGMVLATGRPVRNEDYTTISPDDQALAAQAGPLMAAPRVGVPIVVEGSIWGFMCAGARPFRPDAEERLARFTELVATSVSNATMREELAASRARVIAASDETRRRIERDLHDGAQQRLITLTVALRRADAKLPSGADELRADLTRVAEGLITAVDELRELSRGIHPSILTEGGLSPALKALGRRSPVRVKLDMGFEHRLPDQVEVAAYYTVSEALTNASKHAEATRVWVSLRLEDDILLLSVRDDGVGGADATRGSGLTGLRDRIEALGGTIQIKSPSGSGTLVDVEIPIGAPADRNNEPDGLLSQETPPVPRATKLALTSRLRA
jgi:signal transduction histidine kinase